MNVDFLINKNNETLTEDEINLFYTAIEAECVLLESLRVRQLKDRCREHGIRVGGRKEDLVNRIIHYKFHPLGHQRNYQEPSKSCYTSYSDPSVTPDLSDARCAPSRHGRST